MSAPISTSRQPRALGSRRERAIVRRASAGALTLLGVFAIPARAATYYVATSGSDNAAGSQAAPWKTVQKAANTAAAGDTVIVGDGTYKESVTFSRSGTSSSPITFKKAVGATPIVDGASLGGGAYSAVVKLSGVSYVVLDGLTVRNGAAYCVALSGNTTHVQLLNLDVYGCQGSGAVWVEGATSPSYSVIRGSTVHDNTGGGITLWNSPGGYYLIEQCEVWNNAGAGNYDGIQVGGEAAGLHHVVVRNNTVHDNGSADPGADQIDMGGHGPCHHYVMDGNDVYGSGGAVKMHGNPPFATIMRRNRVTGIEIVEYDRPNPAMIYHNTVVNARGHAVQFWTDHVDGGAGTSYGGMELRNNLFVGSGSYLLILNGVPGFKWDMSYSSLKLDGNMYRFTSEGLGWVPRVFDCQQPDPTGQNEFVAYQAANAPYKQDVRGKRTTAATSAIFADPSVRTYQLAAGSPAIDAGVELTTTTAAGTNSTSIPVVRASFFQDGYGGLIEPDMVQVGSNAPVQIVSVDDANNVIKVASPISWSAGAGVSLPYSGNAPDAGAVESGSTNPNGPPSPPRLLSVDPQ